jgi:mono/diheme cytochrome c family protein
MRIIATFLVLFLAFVVLVVLFVVSGTYNVAAVEPHSAVVSQLFATLRDQSIAKHSQDIQPPPLTDPALVQSGLREYHSMCFSCHGAPGHKPSEIGRGLNPKPPQLDAEEIQRRSDAEFYWIIKNGLRMTGMPAFGPTHEEKELWSIVAFLRQLPEIDAKAYDAMVEAAGLQGGGQMHAHVHGHGNEEEKTAQYQAAMETYTISRILPGQAP